MILIRLLALAAAACCGPLVAQTRHETPCIDGMAGGFACHNVDLVAHVDLPELGTTGGNDIWGWTDPETGIEYALMGMNSGTAFVSLQEPDHPEIIGTLPTQSSNSLWRDIKVHNDHAYIVAEAVDHGMQVFDLLRLRQVQTTPATFTADAVYNQFGRAHNIVINQDSGYAYAVGSRQGLQQCNSGLHMIDLQLPQQPSFAGCFSSDGYTHDAQCVIYAGPDSAYSGREICFNSNEDTLTIVDVTDKQAPVQLSRTPYTGSAYAHQGWLTPDQAHFLMNDELDELNSGHNTRTLFWDVTDLDAPFIAFHYTGPVAASDHNLYVRDQYAYLANYRSGLRIIDLAGIAAQQIEEIAWFDTHPESDVAGFHGAWSSYPYFDSGVVVVSDLNRGLFVLRPQLCRAPDTVIGVAAQPGGDQRIDLSWAADPDPGVSYEVWRELGGCGTGPGERIAQSLEQPGYSDIGVSGQVDYGYRIRSVAESGACSAAFSACVSTQTSGACIAPPLFTGLASVTPALAANCRLELNWPGAQPSCDGPIAYAVHRSQDPDFLPTADNRIADAIGALEYLDDGVEPDTDYHYIVRAQDLGNEVSDANLVRASALPLGPIGDGTWFSGAEIGDPMLTAGDGRHVAWHVVDDIAHSGERSYASGYINGECIALGTDQLTITPKQDAHLRFHTRYGIETGWDGGLVQISQDNGASWQDLTPEGGYPTAITEVGNACGLPVGTGVYGGQRTDWHEQRLPLAGYSGAVRVRWLFSTDSAVSDLGWWIDDVEIEHVQVPGRCEAIPLDRIFASDFEHPLAQP